MEKVEFYKRLMMKQTKTKQLTSNLRKSTLNVQYPNCAICSVLFIYLLLSGEPDYFGRNKISSGGDLSHYSSASLYYSFLLFCLICVY